MYTGDCLVILDNAEATLRRKISNHWDLKEESIGPPNIYLGEQMRRVTLENRPKAWAFGFPQYVKAAIKNVED